MENKKDKKKVKNEKAKNIILKVVHGISYALSGCFVAVCCFACANQSKNNKPKNNDVVYVEERDYIKKSPNLVIYHDDTFYIELIPNELNNYSFENLFETGLLDSVDFTYNSNDFSFDANNDNSLDYISGSTYITFVYDYSSFNQENDLSLIKNYVFVYQYELNNFQYNLEIATATEEDYLLLKSAIELDIQINTKPINKGIFETLTESVVDFVDVLGSGLNDMVDVFYDSDNNQITLFGNLAIIVVSVSLCWVMFRMISSYVRLRG